MSLAGAVIMHVRNQARPQSRGAIKTKCKIDKVSARKRSVTVGNLRCVAGGALGPHVPSERSVLFHVLWAWRGVGMHSVHDTPCPCGRRVPTSCRLAGRTPQQVGHPTVILRLTAATELSRAQCLAQGHRTSEWQRRDPAAYMT